MKTIYKRIWSILLLVAMLFSITSMTASAQESETSDYESFVAGLEFLAAAFSDLGEDGDQASTDLIAVETPEESAPAETPQEKAETEAAPESEQEAEQEAEVTVDSTAPSTKAVISQPWEIIRGDIVYADSPFAVGLNGKPVNSTNCTYLVQNGVSRIAYCIEPGVAITESAVNSGYTADEEVDAWEINLTDDQREAVALTIAYGYPTVSFDHLNATVAEKYAATQLIIWEIILGDRNAVDFTSYKQYCGYFSPATYDGLYAVYNEMHAAMVRHNAFPSFATRYLNDNNASQFTYELPYDSSLGKYVLELKDASDKYHTLPDYDFKSDIAGLTVTRTDDVTLRIECDPAVYESLKEPITFKATGKAVYADYNSVITVYECLGTTDQKLVSSEAVRDPVPVFFRIKAPVITKVQVTKKAANGDLVPDAKLQILDANNKVVVEWITTNEPYIVTGLAYGANYTLHEEYAPPGFVRADDVPFTVAKTSEVQYVEMTEPPTTLIIKKVDENGEPFTGATLQLIDKNGKCIKTWVTGTEPVEIIGEVVVGETYTIHETETRPGYVLAPDIVYEIQDTADPQTLVMVNKPTTLKIDKVDENGKPFVGATLQILDKEGNVVVEDWITDGNPKYVKGLTVGETYTIHEVATIPGYVLAPDIVYTIKDTTETQPLVMMNQPTILKINKVDANGNYFPGAYLQILDKDGDIVASWTSSAGPYVCTGKLVVGETYTLHEVSTVPGYVLAEDVIFAVEDTVEEQPVKMVNDYTKLEISKVDENGDPFVGATLQILDKEGNVVIEDWVTDGTPHRVDKLTVGETYIIHEVATIPGYVLAEDKEFVVADTTEVQKITVENLPTQVQVTKLASEDKLLEGALLQIIDAEGNVVEEWETKEEPHIVIGLEVGVEYTLHEAVTPKGYATADDVAFTVKDTAELQYVEMIDKPITVEIRKVDIAGNELPGAHMRLTDEDGNEIASWISTEEPFVIYGLEVGKTYTLHEDFAPLGYYLAQSVTFTISDTEDSQKVELVNKLTKTAFLKVGEKNEPLVGGVFQILDKDGKVLHEWTSSSEPFVVEGLVVDETYYMHEVTPPKGYELAADVEFTVKETEDVQLITMVDYPVTGDDSNIGLWIFTATTAALVLVAAVVVLFKLRRRELN